MRLKLVIIASLLAAAIGSGCSIALIIWTLGSLKRITDHAVSRHDWTFLLPLFFAGLASLFVYRHTARKRKLQAALTAVLAILFSVIAHIAALLINL